MLKRFLLILSLMFLICPFAIALASDPNDMEGSQDPPIFNRMPGFYIYDYEDYEFDQYEFLTGPDTTAMVEGHYYFVHYYSNDGIKLPSGLQIVRNYTDAIKAAGGQLVYSYDDAGRCATLKLSTGSMEIWASIHAQDGGDYWIYIVEKQAMEQDIVVNITAESLAQSLKDSGKAAVYGIYFDTGKSDIKPESEPTLKEIARMLQADPGLKLYVVGHTDNVGAFDYNVKLSQDRADAVIRALVGEYGIAASRLQPFGAGPTCPAASNLTDEGRSLNRRVELVAQ